MNRIAITRAVSPKLGDCELTHLDREPIDVELASRQHERYCELLAELGCRVTTLPAEPDLADSVFIEDTAVVLDEVAVLTRPGAESRLPELEGVRAALEPHRPIVEIRAPGTVDGGDVLVVDSTVYVGRSSRSNQEAIDQMARHLEPHGYKVVGVDFGGCLHLTSAVTQAAAATLLLQPDWVDGSAFEGLEILETDPSEPMAGNVLRIGESLIYSTSYPKTLARLEARGLDVHALDYSEFAKAEGAVTCCSLVFRDMTGKD